MLISKKEWEPETFSARERPKERDIEFEATRTQQSYIPDSQIVFSLIPHSIPTHVPTQMSLERSHHCSANDIQGTEWCRGFQNRRAQSSWILVGECEIFCWVQSATSIMPDHHDHTGRLRHKDWTNLDFGQSKRVNSDFQKLKRDETHLFALLSTSMCWHRRFKVLGIGCESLQSSQSKLNLLSRIESSDDGNEI